MTHRKSNDNKGVASKRYRTASELAIGNDFFAGLNIYIFPTGMGSSRRSQLQDLTAKFGGSVQVEISDSTTHIIIDEAITIDRLCTVLKLAEPPPHVKVVKTLWLSNCIKANGFLDSKEYEICGHPTIEELCTVKNITPKLANIKTDEDSSRKDDDFKINSPPLAKVSGLEDTYKSFVCSVPSNVSGTNHNQHITDKLEVLSQTYKSTGDHWRAVGYEKAINALKMHPKPITSWKEAKSLIGVGENLADKIWEIVQSGSLRKIDQLCSEEKVAAVTLFTKVWGIGPSTAEAYVQQGCYTLEDLRKKGKLTKTQLIGLKHFDDLQLRMPRSEALDIFNMVEKHTKSINSGLHCVACGSYRRNRDTCGDVDVLVTHPDGESHSGVLSKITALLHEIGFLTDDLVSQEDNGNQKKYMGVCKLPGESTKHRRIDVIVVPYEEYACALMYFTGSAYFNRSIRLLASKKNMSLSEHSLKAKVVRKGQEKIAGGHVLPTPTEESIFAHLGLDYRPPVERDH